MHRRGQTHIQTHSHLQARRRVKNCVGSQPGSWAGGYGQKAQAGRDRDTHHSRARRVSHRFRPSLAPFHIMRAIKEGDRGAWLAGTRACHSSPPAPSASPPPLQGTTDMGCWVSPVSGICPLPFSFPASALAAPAALPSHTPGVPDKTGQLIKTSSFPYLGTFCLQGPLHISPKFNHPSQETRESPQVAYKNSHSPQDVVTAGRRPAFYRKDIVSHILPCRYTD